MRTISSDASVNDTCCALADLAMTLSRSGGLSAAVRPIKAGADESGPRGHESRAAFDAIGSAETDRPRLPLGKNVTLNRRAATCSDRWHLIGETGFASFVIQGPCRTRADVGHSACRHNRSRQRDDTAS